MKKASSKKQLYTQPADLQNGIGTESQKPLWPHQIEALEKMKDKEYFALLMAMRTGKSATILADFVYLRQEKKVDDLVVIAPAGVYRTWETAAKDHLHIPHHIHIWDSKKKYVDPGVVSPCIFLVNVEALSMRISRARKVLEDFLKRRRCYVVIDESTIIKNFDAKRTRYINRSIKPLAKYRRILTGLVSPRDPLDLYTQFEFLDKKILGCDDFYEFRREWAHLKKMRIGNRSFLMVVGFKDGAEESLQKIIKPYSFRVPFRPIMPSTYSIREVAMTPEQEKAYKEMKKYATIKINQTSYVTASIVIAQLVKLHQILCGHIRDDEEGTLHTFPENRTAALMEELEDYSGKAIIWFTYIVNLENCAAELGKEYGFGSVAKFYGNNLSTREAEEERFKTDPNCRFMLATAGAGGRGRTWSVADRVINFSTANNLEHREQSEQRSMGIEKENRVDNVDLVVPNTVEMKILRALRSKIDVASVINGDTWKEWVV